MLTNSLLSISLVTVALPPLHANSGWSSAVKRSTSCRRPDRMGPTGSVSPLWNTIAKRVRLSLTISSKTRSASLKPLCGRAPLALSIFTTSAGRAAITGSGFFRPVNGYTGSAGKVVVVAASVVDAAAVVVVASSVVVVAWATVVLAPAVVADDWLSLLHEAATPNSASRPTPAAAPRWFGRGGCMVISTSKTRETHGGTRARTLHSGDPNLPLCVTPDSGVRIG